MAEPSPVPVAVDPAVLEAARRAVGWRSEQLHRTVEAGHLRRFCEAIGDPNPRWLSEVPPTFMVALGFETPGLPELLAHGRGWLNAGDRLELLEPLRVGDRVTASIELVDVEAKTGTTGALLFARFLTTFVHEGRIAGRWHATRVRR